MSCCRIFLQRGSHPPTPLLSTITRGPLRLRPLASPKSPLLRTLSTTTARWNKAPQDPRLASQHLYPKPDKSKRYLFPERLVIYHAGTGRVIFLAVMKLTTVVMSAIFCGILVPAYITDEKPWWECAGLAVCGVVPLTFVAFFTAPFVSMIHMHLPPLARHSRESLTRFVRALPPQTRLQATTLSLIAKPRVSYFTLGELFPARRRWGTVNFARDTAWEERGRRWWNFRAIGGFNVQGSNKGVKEGWVWKAVRERVERNAAAGGS